MRAQSMVELLLASQTSSSNLWTWPLVNTQMTGAHFPHSGKNKNRFGPLEAVSKPTNPPSSFPHSLPVASVWRPSRSPACPWPPAPFPRPGLCPSVV